MNPIHDIDAHVGSNQFFTPKGCPIWVTRRWDRAYRIISNSVEIYVGHDTVMATAALNKALAGEEVAHV